MTADTRKVADYLRSNYDIGPDIYGCFSVACALYWHCADYHEGQNSERYSILSQLEYRPGMAESGPEDESTDADIYAALESGELKPGELFAWFEQAYKQAKESDD